MKERERHGVVNIGISSIIVILIGLFFSVMAALAISSARNDLTQSEDLAAHTTQYYNAYNEAIEKIASGEAEPMFDVTMNDGQQLHVAYDAVSDKITAMVIENTTDWENETVLPVYGSNLKSEP